MLLSDGGLKFFDSLDELKLRTHAEKLSTALIKAYAEDGYV
jgi:hypothetical protein